MSSGNPFEDLKPILNSDKLVEVVFDKAMKAAGPGGSMSVSPVVLTRRTEAKRVQTCASQFRDRLNEIVFQFPTIEELPDFYRELLDIIYGVDRLRKTLGSLTGTGRAIWKVNREHVSKIWHAKPLAAKQIRRAAFSRFASMIHQLRSRLAALEELRYSLRRLPIFDFDNPIIVVAGYPNVGKSSFVRSVTNARPEVASYPFTTKEVTLGHFQGSGPLQHLRCQVVDTPGLLDRSINERNEIELRALSALLTLPSMILYIFDPTQKVEWSSQIQLYKEIVGKVAIPVHVAVNKTDLFNEDEARVIIDQLRGELSSDNVDPLPLVAKDPPTAKVVIDDLFDRLIGNLAVR